MGKKKDKIDKKAQMMFERGLSSQFYGPGKDARDILDRYNVEGTKSVKPSARNLPEHFRTVDDVKAELHEAMNNDYDTRRTLEAAALAGNEDAKKFAKNGIDATAQDFLSSYQLMKDLKKEYVGGGGMRGPKNEAGLTYALVKEDRDKQTQSYRDEFATKTALQEMQDKIKEEAIGEPPEPEPSKELSIANEGVSDYEAGLGGFGTDVFGGDDLTQATSEATSMTGGSSDAADDYLNEYKANVAGGLELSDVKTRGPKSGIRPGEGF